MVAREIVRIVALVVAIVLIAAIVVAGMLALGVVLDIAVDFAKAALAWMVAHDRAAGAIVAVAIVLAIVTIKHDR